MPEPDEKNTIQLLMGKVESIQRNAEELHRTTRQGKLLSMIVVIAIALAAFLSLYRTYTTIRSFPPRLYTQYMAEEVTRLSPVFQEQFGQLVKNVEPAYTAAFKKEFETNMPMIADKASLEAGEYLKNIGERLETRLTQATQKIVEEHAKALAKDHPELKDEAKKKKVLDQAQEIYYSAAQDVAKEVFAEQTKAIADLGATIDTFETPESLKKMNDEQLIQHTFDTLVQFVARRLSFVEMPEDAPVAAKASAATTQKEAR